MIALALCLLWVTAAVASFYFLSEVYKQDTFSGRDFFVIALLSLLLLIVGLVAFFGRIRVFFLLSYPAVVLHSAIDSSKYNIEKASFVLGILTAAFSYVFFIALMGGWMVIAAFIIALTVFVIGVIYVFVSKRFRTEAQPKY